LLAGLGCIGGSALATTTAPTSFQVNLQIVANCVINSTNALNFPNSGVLVGTNVTSTTTVNVQCTDTTPYTIGLDAGANGTITTRKMLTTVTDGTAVVNYQLCQDALCNTNWDNASSQKGGTGNGQSQQYTIYGLIPPQNTPAPGTYVDTVNVTVTY